MFRADGSDDVVLPGEQVAVDHARTVCQRLADQWGATVTLRKWNGFGRFTEELFAPSLPNSALTASRRRSA